MISVIVTVHKELHHHLKRCLDSICWQLFPHDELLIIADGYCPEIPSLTINCPFKVVELPKKGISASRNKGLSLALYEWIKFIDCDDLLAPFALNTFRDLYPQIVSNEAVLFGQLIHVYKGVVHNTSEVWALADDIKIKNPLIVSSCFIRRSAALEVGGFDTRLEFEEDYDLWLKLHEANHRFTPISVPFCYYWIDDLERSLKKRATTIEGLPIRTYFQQKYGTLGSLPS